MLIILPNLEDAAQVFRQRLIVRAQKMDKLMYEIGELKHRIKQDENKLREMYLFDDATF